ncbi:hypothetical protein SAMN05518672_105123 [Chitinophaga sp. CF118]|uniref:hypothetical protein n=1 Tax=Chitinophaga sp. CF118 TaxID=1884367 RepID=UPI0008ED8857|nr:hypothetical protein [Chitinophaga sp. CF118]SFE27291.1 hypothetical protein SAMN05518672_105123 [Chitinophaga sp. CF118]
MSVKKAFILFLLTCQVLTACNLVSPEMNFDIAVLNCNMITGISGDGLMNELESPSAKLAEGSKTQVVAMTRKETIDLKIHFIEENLKKLNKLIKTEDTKEMIQTSTSLNEYVLAIYKNEYSELAKMYDEGAPREQIQLKGQSIHDKYNTKFEELFEKLTTLGKAYAKKHNIAVKWGINSSPAN